MKHLRWASCMKFQLKSEIFSKVQKKPSQVSHTLNLLCINVPVWNFKVSTGFTKFHTCSWMWNLVNLCEGMKFHTGALSFNHLRIGETCEGFLHTFLKFPLMKRAREMLHQQSSRRKTKQFSSYFRFPTSHTTVRAVRHTAVPILGSIWNTNPLSKDSQPPLAIY